MLGGWGKKGSGLMKASSVLILCDYWVVWGWGLAPRNFFGGKGHQIAPIVFGLEFEKIVMQLLVAAAGSF